MTKVQFTLVEKEDIEKLIEVAKGAFEKDLIKYGAMPRGIETPSWHLEKIEDGMYYKLLWNTEIIGGMKIYKREGAEYRLGSLYVAPAFQGKGVGSEAIRFMEETYPDAVKWTLDTPYQNFENQKFYEGKGFCKIGETRIILPNGNEFILFDYEKTMK